MRKLIPPILILLISFSGCFQKPEIDKSDDSGFKVVPADEKNLRNFVSRLEGGGYSKFYTYDIPVTSADVKVDVSHTSVTTEIYRGETTVENVHMTVERFSKTNVQVVGIDEGDIVKTNGRHIYFSPEVEIKTVYYKYPYWTGTTYIVKAYPPASAEVVGNISHGGILYLYNNTLVIMGENRILSYDVTTPKDPKLKWIMDINGSYIDSRLYNGKLYLVVLKGDIEYPLPWCDIEIRNYYIPVLPSTVFHNFEGSYVISAIDVDSGEVSNVVALPGSESTVVYMSENRIYVAYHLEPNIKRIYLQFIEENLDEYFPDDDVKNLLRNIIDSQYFGDEAKFLETNRVINSYLRTLKREDALNLMNAMEKGFNEYLEKHWEDFEKTGIVGIDIYTFDVKSGSVPGKLINSYALDEYRGYLRVATTIGDYWGYRDRSTNNIYVLKDLEVCGKLTGLAKGERIYGVRFMGNVAYIVTYREKDPLFVIDLSDPKDPKLLGKLKIPGYSTYLHPIDEKRLIGIGRDDNGRLKVSLFNVGNKTNPIEVDRYSLPQYWSPALYNPHAFLWDKDYKVLVIPAGNSCYIFKIEGDRISLKKEDTHKGNVLRSLYINQYLYTISNHEIHIIDMEDWEVVKKVVI